MFYEHAVAHLNEKSVEYDDEEAPPLDMPGVTVRADGARVYNR